MRALTDDSADAATLISAIDVLDAHRDFAILEHVFQRLRELADPRVADALAKYADHASHPHFRTEAALRLAELGDLRAAPHLAWRLGEDPTKLYDASDETTIALRRDDRERVVCARMLADLAMIHPEAHAQLRETAEAQTLAWLKSHPQPHANGLRALVGDGVARGRAALEAPRRSAGRAPARARRVSGGVRDRANGASVSRRVEGRRARSRSSTSSSVASPPRSTRRWTA